MSKKYTNFMGIDPSFVGMGISTIDIKNKKLCFYEFKTDVKDGAFGQIAPIANEYTDELIKKDIFTSNYLIGMEIPPIQGFYAVKLWVLDSMLYNKINTKQNTVWLFNVPYLKYINKKYQGKNDTKEMMNKILEIFKDYGYEISTNLKSKSGKDRKLTSNQMDSFIYCIRMFIKYHMENSIHDDIVTEILEVNDRFLDTKETEFGKDLNKKGKK